MSCQFVLLFTCSKRGEGGQSVEELRSHVLFVIKLRPHRIVSDVVSYDDEVLMLYETADAVLSGKGPMQHMGLCGYTHPDEWFKPFYPDQVSNHLGQ